MLSGGSLFATPEAAEDVQVAGLAKGGQSERGECGSFTSLFWCMFKIQQLVVKDFVYSSFKYYGKLEALFYTLSKSDVFPCTSTVVG